MEWQRSGFVLYLLIVTTMGCAASNLLKLGIICLLTSNILNCRKIGCSLPHSKYLPIL